MENAPIQPDTDKDDTKAPKRKKKNVGVLGGFAVDAKPAVNPGHKSVNTADDIWSRLTLTKRQDGISETVVPLTELPDDNETTPEAHESETLLGDLSPAEEQYVERTIASAHLEQTTPEAAEEADGAERAVARFQGRIVQEGRTAEQAFAATLHELGEPTPAAAETRPDKYQPPAAGPFSLTLVHGETPPAMEQAPLADEAYGDSRNAPPPPAGPGSALSGGGNHAALPPSAATAARVEKEYIPYYNGGDVLGAALIGGIVGYLIGRRRGRIKTERKLKPIQKKLEKRVKQLEQDIQAKEFYIRKAARARRENQQQLQRMEQARDKDTKETARQVALEANQLHGKKVAPERIGHVLMTADERPAPPARKPEKPVEKPVIDKRVETMSRAELLELSDRINVENTTLKQVYETHLVGEQGLRRLVSEYTRGGDVQKALRQELVEHEIDFERDPLLRDKARHQLTGTSAGGQTLTELLHKAGVSSSAETKEELAVLKARQAHHEGQRQLQQKRRQVLDISMITAIAVLFALVITLLLMGR